MSQSEYSWHASVCQSRFNLGEPTMRHNYAARRQIRQLQATRAVMLQKAFNAFTLMTAYAIGVGGIGYMVVSAIKMMAP